MGRGFEARYFTLTLSGNSVRTFTGNKFTEHEFANFLREVARKWFENGLKMVQKSKDVFTNFLHEAARKGRDEIARQATNERVM